MLKFSTIKSASLFLLAIVSILIIVLFAYIMNDHRDKGSSAGVLAVSSILFVGALGFIVTMIIAGKNSRSEIMDSWNALIKKPKDYFAQKKADLNKKVAEVTEAINQAQQNLTNNINKMNPIELNKQIQKLQEELKSLKSEEQKTNIDIQAEQYTPAPSAPTASPPPAPPPVNYY